AAALLRFYERCNLRHSIVVADSSDALPARLVRNACAGLADYRSFDPSIKVVDKLVQAVRSISTPFVAVTPDDDITFPHAVETALTYLRQHHDFAVAHGYVLRFGIAGTDVDIHNVLWFTPSIDDDEPQQRHYHLMRRYQPFIWAVFRTDVFLQAIEAAAKI